MHSQRMWIVVLFCLLIGLGYSSGQNDQILTYEGKFLSNLTIPVGGIGTGNILLGGRGQFEAIEIMNRPNRQKRPAFTFFSIYTKKASGKETAKVLERELLPPFEDVSSDYMNGVPRFREVKCHVPYPFVQYSFRDSEIPVSVQLESYNPLIPLNADDSSIPIAVFNWQLVNPTDEEVEVSISFNFRNPMKSPDRVNTVYSSESFNGIRMSCSDDTDINQQGEILFGSTEKVTSIQTQWFKGAWQDHAQKFWDDFSEDGMIKEITKTDTIKRSNGVASVLIHFKLDPNESKTIPYYLMWYFPKRVYELPEAFGQEEAAGKPFNNYYGIRFGSVDDVLSYYLDNEDRLYQKSKIFSDLMLSGSYPDCIKEAAISQMSSLKTPLLNRVDQGYTHGFEGVIFEDWCCPGTCTHVYNYEQTIASLFPSIERGMREVEYLYNTDETGNQHFRAIYPLGDYKFGGTAADGQMGTLIRVYREWKYSGDTEWLISLWPKIKLAMNFAWSKENQYQWDPKQTGLIAGRQHNTYDIDFYGINPMTSILYLGALKACAEMADHLDDKAAAKLYIKMYNKGVKQCERKLWNGEYFYQPDLEKLEAENYKYQYGEGCLSDQLLGQYLADVSGLGDLIDSQKIESSLKSIFKYNFLKEVRNQHNTQRVYASNDESGLALCSWPFGNKPALPFVYAYEIWTGVEYQAAASMLYHDQVEDGIDIVQAVQFRHDGYKRNPFAHNESGWHYARAMASWALIPAISGYHWDGVKNRMVFDPKINPDHFKTFWSTGTAWGVLEIEKNEVKLTVLYGKLELNSFTLESVQKLVIDDRQIKSKTIKNNVKFAGTQILEEGNHLKFLIE